MPVVYAKNLRLIPRDSRTGVDAFAEAVRAWVGSRWPATNPWFATLDAASLRGEDGSIFRWEPHIDGPREIVDFTWRHADRDEPSISWVTTATYFTVDGKSRLSLRVSNTWDPLSPAPFKATTRPRLLLELARLFNLEGAEGPLATTPSLMTEGDVPWFARYELFDRNRAYPVLVITPDSEGRFPVDPQVIASELVSLARCVVLPTTGATFALTRELGSKVLSVFSGAARIYHPGFSHSSDPFRHPLLFPPRLASTDQRMVVATTLALETVRTFKDEGAIPWLRDERAVALDKRRAAMFGKLQEQRNADVSDWKALADEYAQENDNLRAVRKDLENALRDLNERIVFYEDKVSALEYGLRAKQGDGLIYAANEIAGVEVASVAEAVGYAELLLKDELVLLPSAIASAAESPFARPKRVFELLGALADISSKVRAGPLGKSLKDAFAERGMDYRQGISANASTKIRAQHVFTARSAEYFCAEHLCEGTSYDPRFSLRIYFTVDPILGVVVGHIGRHLDTDETT